MSAVDLGDLGFDGGGHLVVKRALAALDVGQTLRVTGEDPSLPVHLGAWCRAQGHGLEHGIVRKGTREEGRWRGAERAGGAPLDGIVRRPSAAWGLAARGATVEAGAPAFSFPLSDRDVVWADDAPRLYAQAAAAQWDPATAVPWNAALDHADELEDAVVQVMTFLIENETAALLVPSRFLVQVHPHFREVLQLLAIQVADEARHLEVFTRRATLRRAAPGLSTHGGQASLKTLIDEPDFAIASFLLAVLGEGTFLELLWFLEQHGPDEVTRTVARLAGQDEARHVAFGIAHLRRHAREDPALLARLASAVHRRHDALRFTAGLNEEVFDSLVVLAAGSYAPSALALGWRRVQELVLRMDHRRQSRMVQIGFSAAEAQALSALHTRNFM